MHDSSNNRPATSIADQDYAKNARRLIKLMNDLRGLGAQADVDLPRIAVIGNQSAGKSSLVEAICNISVPRDTGTCTRCPMECRLSNSTGPWKCQVLLRFEKDEYGNPLPETSEENFGPVIFDRRELEPMLRRAQLAILNPTKPSSEFVDYDLDLVVPGHVPAGSLRQLQFSSNVVCIDLSGPDVPDLSFIDLPGIISNVAEGEDRNNITLIQNLVKQHIQGNALILLTITMRDDIENQSAAYFAKQADPDGTRTIGVLTKPDTLQAGEHAAWLDVLKGRRHPLHHGYYVTKQPNIEELAKKLSYEEARSNETLFFASTTPWNALVDGNLRGRMGVPNLTRELSRLLSRLIEKTLPKLRSQSKNSMTETNAALRHLPRPVSENPTAELLGLVTSFSAQLEKIVEGSEGHESLIQDCRRAYDTFRDDIRGTKPVFFAKPRTLPADQEQSTDEGNAVSEAGPNSLIMDVNEVRAYINKSITRQLPYNVPFSCKVRLVQQCFESWSGHANDAFDIVYRIFIFKLQEEVENHFNRFENSGLADFVGTEMENLSNTIKEETLARIEWLISLEDPPFTLNDHYFSSYREKYLAKYKGERQSQLEYHRDLLRDAMSALARLNFDALQETDLEKLRGPDPYDQEMIVMAEVRAYFQVAYKRIIDMLPRIIDHDFLKALSKRVQATLITKLGLDQDDASQRAAGWLSEDPEVVEKRNELLLKKTRLTEILVKLHNFKV